jgi:hypothetical protein
MFNTRAKRERDHWEDQGYIERSLNKKRYENVELIHCAQNQYEQQALVNVMNFHAPFKSGKDMIS